MAIRLNNFQVAKKLATCEADLEKAEDRAEVMIVIRFKRGSLPSIVLRSPTSSGGRDKDPGVGGGAESCGKQPKVLGGDGDDNEDD